MYTLAWIGFGVNIINLITDFIGMFSKPKLIERIIYFIGTTISVGLLYFFINYLFM